MMHSGLFDWQTRFEQLDNGGDPLVKLNQIVNWEQFRPPLETIRDIERKSNAGRKPFDVVVMFKIMILQSLYNLSDDQIEGASKNLIFKAPLNRSFRQSGLFFDCLRIFV